MEETHNLATPSTISIPTTFDLIKSLRLSVELIQDSTDRIWRVIWKEKDVPKMVTYPENSLNPDALLKSLIFMQKILAQEPQEGQISEEYIPFKEWSINELEIIERNYILTAKLCNKDAQKPLLPSISLRIPISLTPNPHLIDAINSEVKDMLEQYNLSEDASSFSSSSVHEVYKEILQDSEEDSGKISEDDEMKRNLESNLKGFFELSTTSTSPPVPYIEKGNKRLQPPMNNKKKSKIGKFSKGSKTTDLVSKTTYPNVTQQADLPSKMKPHSENPNTEEQEVAMLSLLDKLQKELLNEHTQLSDQKTLNNNVQLDKHLELLKEIPSKLEESMIKMRSLDMDARILIYEKCFPLHKQLSQVYFDKKKRADTLSYELKISPIIESSPQIFESLVTRGEDELDKEEKSTPNSPSTSLHSLIPALNSIEKSPEISARNDSSQPSSYIPQVNKHPTIASDSQSLILLHECTEKDFDSIPNPLYWKEDEIEKLRHCENLYNQAESAFSLKISLCDDLHSMLENQLKAIDFECKNNIFFHDLLYGKDIEKPNTLPFNFSKPQTGLNVKQKNLPMFSRSAKNSCSESVIPPTKESAQASPPL